MSNLLPQHHKRTGSVRFSREGFKPIPDEQEANMATSNDATIDIPLEQVDSKGQGLRSRGTARTLNKEESNTSQPHKRSMFRGRRQKPDAYGRKSGKVGYDGEEDTVNTMGHIYKKVMGFSAFTRYLLYVFPLAALIAIPIIIMAVTGDNATIGGVRVLWFFTWVEFVWLSLWGAKTVAHYLPYLFQVLAGVVSSGVRKYSMVIRALEIQISLVGWAIASLLTFKPVMTQNSDFKRDCARLKAQSSDLDFNCQQQWLGIMGHILAATVIAAFIYLGEKTVIQLISINYHRKQFNVRIKESKHNIWILGLLYEASRALFPMYCNEFAEEDYVIADQLNISRTGHSKRQSYRKSGSHTPIRIIQDIGHAADKITSAFGHVAQEVTGKQVFNPNSAHSIVVEALEKNRTAEALAKRIWMSFVVEGRDALLPDDIEDVMGPDRKTEAEEAFYTFDHDGNGDVSLDEFILTVTQWGRDRKAIASSMHDVDQAINVLDRLLAVVAFIIIVLVYVGFLNPDFTTTLATTGTALLSLSFVFSASAQEVLGSCIFLFVKHPFDIGDRVDIGTSGCANQEQFVVEHISLLFCVFRHVQGVAVGRLCQIPNLSLNGLWIENVSRSKAMTEQLSIDIAFGTSFDDLQILKNELVAFVTDKDNARDFHPTIDIDVLGTSDQSKLSLLVEVKHKSNWANETVRRARRSKFMCALVSALKTVPIYPPGGGVDVAGSAALPSYSVAISNSEAKEFAQQAADDREKARLVPSKKVEEAKERLSPQVSKGAGMTSQDNKIAENLTNRNPVFDSARDDTWGRSDDSSTLGDRPSMERQDIEEVRGMLRRESTRGKRKISQEYHPSVPTISEPEQGYAEAGYPLPQAQAYTTDENQRPSYSTVPAPYRSALRSNQYQPPQYQLPTIASASPPIEMSQVPAPAPSRSPSNPYRTASNNNNYLNTYRGDAEDEYGNPRPYSGV